jgi:hypothetical protein
LGSKPRSPNDVQYPKEYSTENLSKKESLISYEKGRRAGAARRVPGTAWRAASKMGERLKRRRSKTLERKRRRLAEKRLTLLP